MRTSFTKKAGPAAEQFTDRSFYKDYTAGQGGQPDAAGLRDDDAQMSREQRSEQGELVIVDDEAGQTAQTADGAEVGAPEVEVLEPGSGEIDGADRAVLQGDARGGAGAQIQLVNDAVADLHVRELGSAQVHVVEFAAVDPHGLPAAFIELRRSPAGVADLDIPQAGPGRHQHRGVRLGQDAVTESRAPQLRLIEGHPGEFALGKVRTAQVQTVCRRAAVPDAVVPDTPPELRGRVVPQIPGLDRREPGGGDLGGFLRSSAPDHHWDSALAAMSARSFASALRVMRIPSGPNTVSMILLNRVGLMTSAPKVSVRSVPPPRSASANLVV